MHFNSSIPNYYSPTQVLTKSLTAPTLAIITIIVPNTEKLKLDIEALGSTFNK